MPAFEVVSPYEPAGESPKNILFFGGPLFILSARVK